MRFMLVFGFVRGVVGGRVTGAARLARGLRRKRWNLENIVSSSFSLALIPGWWVYIGVTGWPGAGEGDLAWCFFGVSTFPWFWRLWFRFVSFRFVSLEWALVMAFGVC
jgi:hypothetical protein